VNRKLQRNSVGAAPKQGPVRQSGPTTRRQLARFLVVGSASVAVDLAVYALLTAVTPLAWGLCKGASYAAGVVVGFFGNKFWTFKSGRRGVSEPVMYLLLYSLTLLLNIGCNQLALALLGPPQKLAAFVFATGVTMVANFLGMKFVTFRDPRSHAPRGKASGDARRPLSAAQSVESVPTQSAGASD
jgi:putative flippase GtrA